MAASNRKPNSSKPPPLPPNADRRPTNKRLAAIEEFVKTEERYVRTLAILVSEFVAPIEEQQLLRKNEIDTMFSDIKPIANLNGNFLRDLKTMFDTYDDNTSEIGKVCISFFPYLKMYRKYCANHQKAAQMLSNKIKRNTAFSRFVEGKSRKLTSSVSSRSTSNYDLPALMILPVQRCCKYELFLKDILSNTQQSHPDFGNLQKAYKLIQDIVTEINKGVSDIEQREIVRTVGRKLGIDLLDPARKFKRYGEIWKKSKSNSKRDQLYTFFVFNNLIIYAKKTGDQFTIKRQLEINDAFSVVDIPDHDKEEYSHVKGTVHMFQLFTSEKSFYCYTDTEEQKLQWLEVFQAIQAQIESTIGVNRKHTPAPIWQADSSVTHCSIAVCNKKFGLFNRRHHCRVCGFVVCGECSNNEILNHKNEKQRVCRICFERMNTRKSAPPLPARNVHTPAVGGAPSVPNRNPNMSRTQSARPPVRAAPPPPPVQERSVQVYE